MEKMTIVVLIVLGFLVIVVLSYMIRPIWSQILGDYVKLPKQGEKARFIRYLGCAVALCTHGCGSDKLITHDLEYEGNKVVKSCGQLIDEFGYCDGMLDGTKICSDDTNKYPIDFTFKEEILYEANYQVIASNLESYGTCGMGDGGWQTDVSCIGRWRESHLMDDPCFTCGLDQITKNLPSHFSIPTGVLFSYNNADECNARKNEEPLGYNYDPYCGSLWVSQDYANNNCEGSAWLGSLENCKFNIDDTIWIWSDKNAVTASCINFFGMHCFCGGITSYQCPKLILCDTEP